METANLSTLPLVCFNAILALLVLVPVLFVLGDGILHLFSRTRPAPDWQWEERPGDRATSGAPRAVISVAPVSGSRTSSACRKGSTGRSRGSRPRP